METNATTRDDENIFEKAENYTRTSIELVKLKTVSASADVLSTLTSKIAVGAVVAFFTLFLNIGLSLWIGKQLGEYSYGFFYIGVILPDCCRCIAQISTFANQNTNWKYDYFQHFKRN